MITVLLQMQREGVKRKSDAHFLLRKSLKTISWSYPVLLVICVFLGSRLTPEAVERIVGIGLGAWLISIAGFGSLGLAILAALGLALLAVCAFAIMCNGPRFFPAKFSRYFRVDFSRSAAS